MRAADSTSEDSDQPPGLGDDQVIDRVLAGDRDQYALLVGRYQKAAWSLAYGFVGNFEDAKELSQNAFVKAYQHLGRFRRQAKFSTWLYRIVANECKDFLRHRARQPRLVSCVPELGEEDDVIFEVADDAASPSQVAQHGELAKQLARAIQGLTGNQHRAFVLHHLSGLSLEDAARIMGCRIGTLKTHLHRACWQLRRRLASSEWARRIEKERLG